MKNFCECESAACHRHPGAACHKRRRLGLYRVAAIKQTLCPECAEVAQDFCDSYGYRFDVMVDFGAQRRRWNIADWVWVVIGIAMWFGFEILPAFFDGRVARAVGR